MNIIKKLSVPGYWSLIICCMLPACKSQKKVTSGNTLPTVSNIQTIDFPIFIPVSELQKQLYQSVFAAGKGKYYPCTEPNCDPNFKDIYLENPVISIKGNQVSIKVHIAGTAHLVVLSTTISEDITLVAKPQVQNDTLFFRNIQLEQSSNNLLLNLTSALFRKTVEQKIQKYAWFSFHPLLNVITNQAKKQLPVKWGGAVLLLNLNAIHLKSVSIQTTPNEGVLADFSADLQTEDSSFGR